MKSTVKKKSLNTLANKITLGRIVLIPAILISLLEAHLTAVVILLTISILTDFFDGLAARKLGERTKLGAFLDPLADKLLLTSLYMTLTYLDLIETWVFVIIFARDLLIVLGWNIIFILTSSSEVHPRWLGKSTAAVQMITALVIILTSPADWHRIFIWTTIALTIASAIDYILVGERKLGEWS